MLAQCFRCASAFFEALFAIELSADKSRAAYSGYTHELRNGLMIIRRGEGIFFEKSVVRVAEQSVLLAETAEMALSPRRVCRPEYILQALGGEKTMFSWNLRHYQEMSLRRSLALKPVRFSDTTGSDWRISKLPSIAIITTMVRGNFKSASRKARGEGGLIRAEAIHSQLELGFTLCTLADQSIKLRHFDRAHQILERLRRSTRTIAYHLHEPYHVTADLLPKLRVELQQLETQMAAIEIRLSDSWR
jgi:hypothetical protein